MTGIWRRLLAPHGCSQRSDRRSPPTPGSWPAFQLTVSEPIASVTSDSNGGAMQTPVERTTARAMCEPTIRFRRVGRGGAAASAAGVDAARTIARGTRARLDAQAFADPKRLRKLSPDGTWGTHFSAGAAYPRTRRRPVRCGPLCWLSPPRPTDRTGGLALDRPRHLASRGRAASR